MTSSRPYLIRALYEWINDNQLTPYILVNAEMRDVEVPRQYVKEGKIVLNISPDAVDDILITNVDLKFNAAFSGVSRFVCVPVNSVLAIYAQENGQGMVFGEEPGGELPPDNSKYDSNKDKTNNKPKAQLKRIK